MLKGKKTVLVSQVLFVVTYFSECILVLSLYVKKKALIAIIIRYLLKLFDVKAFGAKNWLGVQIVNAVDLVHSTLL